jgi:hypothetical protein
VTVLDRNPSTTNFLSPINFQFQLRRAPNCEFYIQKANIPGFSIKSTAYPTPFVNIPFSGDHVDFETLDIVFSVDENMSNYLELYTWLMSLGFPNDFQQYADLLKNPEWTSLATKSEIVLTVMDNAKNPAFHVNYHGCFPIGLSGLDFDTRIKSPEPITVACSFMYSRFEIERVN